MPTLGTQLISTSYPQLLKTFGIGGIDGTLQVVTDGDDTSSALRISTTGVNSTGSLSVDGASTLTGAATFGTNITASTGTATIGTIASTTINNTGLATVGTLEIGGLAGPKITNLSYGTAAFTGSTFHDLDSATAGSNVTTGTFTVTGAALGDIVFGGLTSIGSSTGTNATLAQRLIPSFRVESTDTIRYVILNTDIVSHGTTPAGTLYATAMRFTA